MESKEILRERAIPVSAERTIRLPPTGLFVENVFVAAADAATFDTINLATDEKIAAVALAGAADVDRAAARRAFEGGGEDGSA